MTTITRSQQLATTAIGIIGMGKISSASTVDPTSPEFKRAAARFMGNDPVFTRAIEAEDAAVGIEPTNMEVKDGEAFKFDAVASVGSSRIVFHPRERCLVRELMDIRPETVDLSVVDAQKGVPFYREHIHSDFYQLGRVDRFEVEAGRIVARDIRLSRRDDVKGYRQDVADGIMRGVSLGYKHLAYTMEEPAQTGDFPICRVNKILIVELSSTSMPADIYCGIIEASIRSAYPNDDAPDAVIATRSASADGITATRADTTNQGTPDMTTPASAPTSANPAAPAAGTDVLTRSDAPIAQPQGVITNASTFDPTAFATRSAELVTIARQANLADDVLTRAIADPSITADMFRSQAFAAIVSRQTPGITAGNDVATRGDRTGAMIDAIVCRMNGSAPTGLATEYMRHTIGQMAEESLAAAGHVIARNDPNEVFTRTFLQTSDFGTALNGAIARTLVNVGGTPKPRTYELISENRDLPNFLPNKAVDHDMFPVLKLVNEGGEIKYGEVGTGEFDVLLKTFALGLRVTRQAFVNDGLGLFPSVVRSLQRRIPIQKNAIVYFALFLEAYKVAKGQTSKALIPGTNLLPEGSTLTAENVDAAKVLMTSRTLRDATDAGMTPRYLVVGPKNESKAINICGADLSALGKVNTNATLTPVVDNSIKGDSWFIVADKEDGTPAFQHGGLIGSTGVVVEPWAKVRGYDGVEMEARMDFYGAVCSTFAIAGNVDKAAYANAAEAKALVDQTGLTAPLTATV